MIQDSLDLLPDKNQIFLRQFPKLSHLYAKNKELIRRNKNIMHFDIKYGDF